jgi:tetratricopeptide (TPR) repeat protein
MPDAVKAQVHYDTALEMLNEGATVKAVFARLDNCLSEDSTFENAYFLKAFVFYKLQAFEDAIGEYDKLLRINPYHEEALKNRALTKLQVYDLEGAIDDHNRRLLLEPLNANIYFDRAYCKGLQKDIRGSIEDYTKAIELNPAFTKAIANRGKAKMNLATSGAVSVETISVEDACSDLDRARIMGDTSGLKLLSTYCNLSAHY